MAQQQDKKALNILRRRQVESKLSISRTTIYDRFNPNSPSYDPTFPKPIELGTGKNPPVGWIESDLDAWIMIKAENAAANAASPHQITQTLHSIAAQVDSLCWSGDTSNALMPPARGAFALELQAVLGATLALAWKYGLAENVCLDLHGPVLEEGRLTSIEAIRQLCHGSRCPEAFAEDLRNLANQLTKEAGNA